MCVELETEVLMRAKIGKLGKRVAIMSTMAAMAVVGMPGMNAFAATSTVEVPDSGQKDEVIKAYFDVKQSDLEAMGYNPTVVIPVSMNLSYDDSKGEYTGSDVIYAAGVILENKKVQVKIDTLSEHYGKVYEINTTDNIAFGKDGFNCTLSKENWTSTECYANLRDKMNGEDISSKSTISVHVPTKNFVPKKPEIHMTNVPISIKLVEG